MTTTTVRLPSGIFKTTDENGNVTFSQTLPSTSTLPKPSSTTNGGFKPNAKGVVRTIVPLSGAKAQQLMENLRAHGELRALRKAQIEEENANQNKLGGVGVHAGIKLVLPNGDVVFEKKIEAGHVPTDTSLSKDFDLGGPIKNAAGIDVPTPGLSVGAGASISAEGQKKLGMSEGQRAAALKAKEMNEHTDKIKEKFKKDVLTDPKAANDQLVKDSADLARKWGKEAADALLK
jgi:hypothetical protein